MNIEEEELYLLIATFANITAAQQAQRAVRQIKKQEKSSLIDIALVTRDDESHITISESEDVDSKRGAVFGGVVGFMVGLLAGPLGVMIALPTGAVLGGIAAHAIDMGIPNHRLQELAETLTPGTAELVVVANEALTTAVGDLLQETEAEVHITPIKGDVPQKIEEMAEKAEKTEKT